MYEILCPLYTLCILFVNFPILRMIFRLTLRWMPQEKNPRICISQGDFCCTCSSLLLNYIPDDHLWLLFKIFTNKCCEIFTFLMVTTLAPQLEKVEFISCPFLLLSINPDPQPLAPFPFRSWNWPPWALPLDLSCWWSLGPLLLWKDSYGGGCSVVGWSGNFCYLATFSRFVKLGCSISLMNKNIKPGNWCLDV